MPILGGTLKLSKKSNLSCCDWFNPRLGSLQSEAVRADYRADYEVRPPRFAPARLVSKFASPPNLVLSPPSREVQSPWRRVAPKAPSRLLPSVASKWKRNNARKPSQLAPELVDDTYRAANLHLSKNRRLLETWIGDLSKDSTEQLMLHWVAPAVPFWARSQAMRPLIRELRRALVTVSTVEAQAGSSEENTESSNVKILLQSVQEGDRNVMKTYGHTLPEVFGTSASVLGAKVELLIVPNRFACAIYHYQVFVTRSASRSESCPPTRVISRLRQRC